MPSTSPVHPLDRSYRRGVIPVHAAEQGMPGTTQELHQEIQRIDRLIADIEAKPRHRRLAWSTLLEELREEREMLTLVILNRRVEAAKKIVSLKRWREGPWAA
jgi:hypothetical protein